MYEFVAIIVTEYSGTPLIIKDTPELRNLCIKDAFLKFVPNMLFLPLKWGHLSIQDTVPVPKGVLIRGVLL